MLDEFVSGIRRSRTDNEALRLQVDAEAWLTTADVRRLIAQSFSFPPATQTWTRQLAGLISDADPDALLFQRQRLHPSVDLFADPDRPRSEKTLVIAYSSIHARLFYPVSVMLNFLPSRQVDVAMIRDPYRCSFLLGLGGDAAGFLTMHRWMERALRFGDYRRVIAFGASMGGLPALRTALLLGLERGISLGGRYHWQIRRLVDASFPQVPAFDVLCACWARQPPRLICAYASGIAEDVRTVEMVDKIVRIERVVVQTGEHNLLAAIFTAGQLRPFLSGLLGI